MPERYRRPHSHERAQAVARMKREQQAQARSPRRRAPVQRDDVDW